jgi:hypothetical protein
MSNELEIKNAIKILQNAPEEIKNQAVLEINSNISALSNNNIASNNRAVNVNVLGEKNTFNWSFFGKNREKHFKEFMSTLPLEIQTLISIQKDTKVIYEIFTQASHSTENHKELKYLLEKYINPETDLIKLQISQTLSNLKIVNKKLMNLLYMINLVTLELQKQNKDYVFNNLPNDLFQYSELLLSDNTDSIYYLVSSGLITDTTGFVTNEYPDLVDRIAFIIGSWLHITEKEQREILKNEIKEKYDNLEKFRSMCDFIYNCDLHKLQINVQGRELARLFQYTYTNNTNSNNIRIDKRPIKIKDLP